LFIEVEMGLIGELVGGIFVAGGFGEFREHFSHKLSGGFARECECHNGGGLCPGGEQFDDAEGEFVGFPRTGGGEDGFIGDGEKHDGGCCRGENEKTKKNGEKNNGESGDGKTGSSRETNALLTTDYTDFERIKGFCERKINKFGNITFLATKEHQRITKEKIQKTKKKSRQHRINGSDN
jgi:hypothetical protein